MKRIISLNIDEEILREIDCRARAAHMSRSAYINVLFYELLYPSNYCEDREYEEL